MSRTMTIAGRVIDDDARPFVIAELGHNHQGSVATASKMIEAAALAGADAVKLQKRDNRALFTRAYFDRPYTGDNAFGPTYGAHREALELDRAAHEELQAVARSCGVILFSTPFDIPSVHFLAELGVPALKIASACLTDTPLIRAAACVGVPVLISTGGGTWDDVDAAHEALGAHGDHAFLHCTAVYPAPARLLNLRAIASMRAELPDVIGYSSHFSGVSMPLVAYALGARILEVHFTLDRTMRGTDHAFSLEPEGMRRLVRYLERAHEALGHGDKRPYPEEAAAIAKMGKSAVAARHLIAGHVVTPEDVAYKSPGGGVPPSRGHALSGRVLMRPLEVDEPFPLYEEELP